MGHSQTKWGARKCSPQSPPSPPHPVTLQGHVIPVLLIPSWASATLPIRSLASRADQWAADSLSTLEPVWRLKDHVQPTSRKPPTGQAGEAPPDGPQGTLVGPSSSISCSLVIRSQGCGAFSPPDPQCSHRGGVRPSNAGPGSLCWEKLLAQAPLLPWTPKLVGKTPASSPPTPAPPTLRLDRHARTGPCTPTCTSPASALAGVGVRSAAFILKPLLG